MASASRRSMLKGLAAMAVAGSGISRAFGYSCPGCPGPTTLDLNVVLHGMFVLDFQYNQILMLSPCVDEHLYRAGNWLKNQTYGLSSPGKLTVGRGRFERPAETYCLLGPSYTAQRPSVRKDFSVVLSKQELQGISNFKIDPSQSKFKVLLPFPQEIRTLRSIKSCKPFDGADSYLITTTGLSLCQVLVYRNVPTATLELRGTDWKYRLNDPKDNEPPTANLHFWAEPPFRVTPEHAAMAAHHLQDLDGLDFYITLDESPPLDCAVDIPGVRPYETQGWAEWVSGGEGTRPVNCGITLFM